MVYTKKVDCPECLWCGRTIRPNYERLCVDCHHPEFKHQDKSAPSQRCREQGCNCTATHSVFTLGISPEDIEKARYQNRQFPQVVTGFGPFDNGLFHSQMCGLRWAIEHAKQRRKYGIDSRSN